MITHGGRLEQNINCGNVAKIAVLNVWCAQLTRDLFAIAKFLSNAR